MKYPINLPGFEGQKIELQSARLFSGPKLLAEGQPAPKGHNRGEFLLRRNDGKDVVVKFKGVLLDVPNLLIDGETVQVADPLTWYEWIWNGLPLLVIVGGGAIPIFIGFAAFSVNLSIFRRQDSPLAKYGLTGLVTFGAFMLLFLVAAGFSILTN